MGLGKLFRRRKTRQKKAAQELARKVARSSNAASSTPHTIVTVEIISIEGPSMTCLEAIATNLTPRFDEQQHFNNTSPRHVETLLATKRTSSRVSQNSNNDSSDFSEDEHNSESSSSSSSQSHSSQSHSDESDETSKVYIGANEEQEEEDEDHDDSSCSSNSSQFTQDTVSIIHRNVIVASDDLEQVFSALQSIEDIEELDESSFGDEGDIDLNPIENGSRTTASTNSKSLCKSVLSRSYKSLDDKVSKSSTTHDTGSVYTNRPPAVQCYPNNNSFGYLFDFVTCTKTDRGGCIAGAIDDDNFTIATHGDNESMLTGRLGGLQKISMFGRSEWPSLEGELKPKENVGSAMKLVSVTTEKTVHTTNCTSESLSKVEEEGDNGDWNESDEASFVFFDNVCAPTKCQGLRGDSDSVDKD
eukprot:CAMPEP_0194085994 /NCGR_PEP_ID=MMETSP0149-20130528/19517_1 /TAXON_ID=122233 /ORGANISM="Chaetoceros debilis, Strain MM31A-1" /LENGTH=415 /DNA_ID=CAMNT_0038768989 /DNA_START=223 /DNA_END=1467 /DNA_ORIENTATION=+